MPRPPALRIAILLLSLVSACVRGPQTFAIQRLPPHPFTATRLSLPPLGQTRAEHLVDGAPVWVVRTADDRVFVLAADARVELGDRGWRVLVAYDPDCDCFRGAAPVVWGPDGAISAGTQPDYDRFFRGAALGIRRPFDDVTAFQLDRHAFTRDGEAIVVGQRSAAAVVSTRERRPVTTIVDTPGPHTQCATSLRPTAWSEALRQPAGQVVLVNASVAFEDATPRLCPAHEPRCSDATSNLHVAGRPVGRWVVPGPVIARRSGSGFAEVVTDASCAASAFLPFGPPLR
jgi:hypothetical protein